VVETSWYHNPVNLIAVLPPPPIEVHVEAGEPLAQVVPIGASSRAVQVDLVEAHRRDARECLSAIRAWHVAHDEDRSAYRRRARSRHGRLLED
jgi:hypothetical protein